MDGQHSHNLFEAADASVDVGEFEDELDDAYKAELIKTYLDAVRHETKSLSFTR